MIKMVAFGAESILKLLKKYSIKNDEFYYVGDAISDVTACREVSVTCLSAVWSDSVELKDHLWFIIMHL